jgi:transposase-like protein
MKSITALRRATTRRASAEEAWRAAIRTAHAEGIPIRAIGKAAGISHVHVLRIVRGHLRTS